MKLLISIAFAYLLPSHRGKKIKKAMKLFPWCIKKLEVLRTVEISH